jgi:alkylhydroperoxidase family enzyme
MNSHRREEMPMSRVLGGVAGATDLDRIWGTRPEFYALFMEDYGRSIGRVDPIIVELCRLRIAQMVESAFDLALRYAPAAAAGLSEEKVAALADYPTSPHFTPRDQASSSPSSGWCSLVPSATTTWPACRNTSPPRSSSTSARH